MFSSLPSKMGNDDMSTREKKRQRGIILHTDRNYLYRIAEAKNSALGRGAKTRIRAPEQEGLREAMTSQPS